MTDSAASSLLSSSFLWDRTRTIEELLEEEEGEEEEEEEEEEERYDQM